MGTIKLVLGFLVVIAVVIAGFQIAPPLLANYSFQDDLRTVALIDGSNIQKTSQDVLTDVLAKAKEHELNITSNQVTIQDISTPGVKSMYITVDYSVPVNLPFYSFDMHFTPNSGNRGF